MRCGGAVVPDAVETWEFSLEPGAKTRELYEADSTRSSPATRSEVQ